ncbi:hypothetical protein FDZ73_18055 [bacterium]|nr:MAG: hypothetical protein FDZ73_18055 [bacterium]
MSSDKSPYGVFRDIPDGAERQRVGIGEFTQKVTLGGGRKMEDVVTSGLLETAQGRDVIRTRYRSNSFTESHFTTGDKTKSHNSYHYSATENKMYQIRGEQPASKKFAELHDQGLKFK